jgi:3-methyladenine DNA glycosylase/8-oxoguanine DNA glycosylase
MPSTATPRAYALQDLRLRGAGGEPVLLARTLASHGVASLPPMQIDTATWTLDVTLPVPRGARTVRVSPADERHAHVALLGRDAGESAHRALLAQLRHMFRLDEDLSPFYEIARADTELAWAALGAGRMLRSPTVFEDVVKTICTTNCAWGGTVRMVTALVGELGVPAAGTGLRTFPTPEAMAAAGAAFYKDVARAGYRAAYLRQLADDVASGVLDLELLNDPDLSDDDVEARLLALPGVGPYAAAHVMLTSLWRYSRARARLVDAPDIRAPRRPQQGGRPHHCAPLRALRCVRRARVLAALDPQLGRRGLSRRLDRDAAA